MTYRYEPLTDENWRELVRLHPNGPYPSGRPTHWLNDAERDIQLMALGGRGSQPAHTDLPPDFYLMLWQKKVVRFESRYTSKITGEKSNQKTIWQQVFSVYAPKELAAQEAVIRNELPIAFLAKWRGGFAGTYLEVVAVNVHIAVINFI